MDDKQREKIKGWAKRGLSLDALAISIRYDLSYEQFIMLYELVTGRLFFKKETGGNKGTDKGSKIKSLCSEKFRAKAQELMAGSPESLQWNS